MRRLEKAGGTKRPPSVAVTAAPPDEVDSSGFGSDVR